MRHAFSESMGRTVESGRLAVTCSRQSAGPSSNAIVLAAACTRLTARFTWFDGRGSNLEITAGAVFGVVKNDSAR